MRPNPTASRAATLAALLIGAAVHGAAAQDAPSRIVPAQGAAGTPAPVAAAVPLAPHRAVYDLTLDRSRGPKGVESARGRIVYEFTGAACEGYATTFRQVTELTGGEIGTRRSDARSTSFEEGDGGALRFSSDTRIGPRRENVEGRAKRGDDGVAVTLTKPKKDEIKLDGDILFPTAHLAAILRAAREGERVVEARTYDGADDGQKVYDATALIGPRVAPGAGREVEDAAKLPALDALPSWPVTVSYFAPGTGERTPAYVLSYVLYEDGIARRLRLDYGDFTLKGELAQLELLKAAECAN